MAVSSHFKDCSVPTVALLKNWIRAHAAYPFEKTNKHFFGLESLKKPVSLNGWAWFDLRRLLIQLSSDEYLRTANAHASHNLVAWKKSAQKTAGIVTVHGTDWGQLAQIKTRLHGEMYTILHETDGLFPCGVYFGQNHQAQPYFMHRTTFALSLADKNIYYDQSTQQFIYHPSMRQLLAGKMPMNMYESSILARNTSHKIETNRFKTYLNPMRMLYLKSNELILYANTQHDIPENYQQSNLRMQLRPLTKQEVFPFIELRSAKIGNNIQQTIAAQLDTLIAHDLRYILLSDWGCHGQNATYVEKIARMYHDEIAKRSGCFSDICFAIQQEKHVSIFKNNLEGLSLRTEDTNTNTNMPVAHI